MSWEITCYLPIEMTLLLSDCTSTSLYVRLTVNNPSVRKIYCITAPSWYVAEQLPYALKAEFGDKWETQKVDVRGIFLMDGDKKLLQCWAPPSYILHNPKLIPTEEGNSTKTEKQEYPTGKTVHDYVCRANDENVEFIHIDIFTFATE